MISLQSYCYISMCSNFIPLLLVAFQVTSRSETFLYVILFIALDLGKVMSSYALKYYNDDKYPVAQVNSSVLLHTRGGGGGEKG